MHVIMRVLRAVALLAGALLLVIGMLAAWWVLRPNRAHVDRTIVLEDWPVARDGTHNSNTDLLEWQGHLYIVYASSPFHFASEASHLLLSRSADGRTWELLAQFDASGEDIRDPKLAVIGGRMLLFALKNTEFTAEPYATVVAGSRDGRQWEPFAPVEPQGWLFWRPKSIDGSRWYVPAYWHEHTGSSLLISDDGLAWRIVAPMFSGSRIDETDIEFLPDGRMIATARLEVSDGWLGDPGGSTLIATASPPYTQWTQTARSAVTRLDGPNLFTYNGRVYAVGRFQPEISGPLFWPGSILARKRTALFLVGEDGLEWLTDLPSAGDTSYAGLVRRGSELLVCYYTSDIRHDVPWIVGMIGPSEVRMARLDLARAEALAVGIQ